MKDVDRMTVKRVAPRRLSRIVGVAGICAVAALVGATMSTPVTAVPTTVNSEESIPPPL